MQSISFTDTQLYKKKTLDNLFVFFNLRTIHYFMSFNTNDQPTYKCPKANICFK